MDRARDPVGGVGVAHLLDLQVEATGDDLAVGKLAVVVDAGRGCPYGFVKPGRTLVLRDVCELDYAEIAAHLGIPAGTVKSRIHQARADLRDYLVLSP